MPHVYLRRLVAAHYRGTAAVHWSMTIDGRRTGWLDTAHHAAVRELLLHTLARYRLACPAYCLMPDHGHFLWLGTSPLADQRKAAAFFRRHWNLLLRAKGCELQLQGYDHVLREEERQRGAFAVIATYILDNPVRAGLTDDWRDYPYTGAIVVGRPEIDPRATDFWERLWRHWNSLAEPTGSDSGDNSPQSADG